MDPMLIHQMMALFGQGGSPVGEDPDYADVYSGEDETPRAWPFRGVQDKVKGALRSLDEAIPKPLVQGDIMPLPPRPGRPDMEMLRPGPGAGAASPRYLDSLLTDLGIGQAPDQEMMRPGPGSAMTPAAPSRQPPGLSPIPPARNVGPLPGMGPDVEPSPGAGTGDPTRRFDPVKMMNDPPTLASVTGQGGAGRPGGRGFDPLLLGLAIAAGNRPGSSLLGAVGRGGLGYVQQQNQERRLDVQEQREGRAERQRDRQLDLEERKIVEAARQRVFELAQKAEDRTLDRQSREALARERMELQRSIAEAQAGNARAMQDLRLSMQKESTRQRTEAAISEHVTKRTKDLTGGLGGDLTPQQQAQLDKEVVDIWGFKTEYGRKAASRELADAVGKITAMNIPEDEKKRRIALARQRYEQLVGQE